MAYRPGFGHEMCVITGKWRLYGGLGLGGHGSSNNMREQKSRQNHKLCH